MSQTIRFIASRITDSSRPLADRAALARWAVLVIAQDQRYAHLARN
jgi:hypothetical protein